MLKIIVRIFATFLSTELHVFEVPVIFNAFFLCLVGQSDDR